MSAIIFGLSTNPVPSGMTVPSDGDGPGIKAADVVAPMQALLDGEANLKAATDTLKARADANDLWVGQLRVLNWPYLTSVPTMLAVIAWDASTSRVLVAGYSSGGSQPQLYSVGEPGTISADFLSGVGAGERPCSVAVNPAGQILVGTNGRYVFRASHATATGNKFDVYGAALTGYASVAWDPIRSKWIWFAWDGTVCRVKWSPDQSTWTAGTISAGFTPVAPQLGVRPDTGLVMAAGISSGTTIYCAVSTDGGATWTIRGNNTTALSGVSSYLTFDANTNAWLLVVSKAATAPGTEVWRSTDDGSNWTKVATLGTVSLGQIAVDPTGALIAPTFLGASAAVRGYAISRNNGATWSILGVSTYPDPGYSGGQMLFTGSQFVSVLNGTGTTCPVAFSLRAGTPALTAIT